MIDQFGEPVAATQPQTVDAWDASFTQHLDFRGDPIGSLTNVCANDRAFVLGPVFSAACRVLGAVSPIHPLVVTDLHRAIQRVDTPREVGHVEALQLIVAGEFGQAARRWDEVTAAHPRDLLAIRLAHDVYLHDGDADGRLRSSQAAITGWQRGERGHSVVAGQLSFAYEELGDYAEAERWGRISLDDDPGDVWARHALAHVYESEGRHDDSMALLGDANSDWPERALFANHLWWHYAIRALANGDTAAAIDVLDHRLGSVSAFDLCDTTSLVWRMELAGLDVAARWRLLAEQWTTIEERHTSAFIDVHTAMVYAAVDCTEAARFWAGLDASHVVGDSENDVTFQTVVKPLVVHLRALRGGDDARAAAGMRKLLPRLHRIGGSVIQRSIFVDMANDSS